jgi:hypothetical protein
MTTPFKTDEEIQAVVDGFEQCTTGKAEFTHLSHLTVATFYLRAGSPDQAFQKMRAGLLRFLKHHKVPIEKYSDEITLAWLQRTQEVLAELDARAPLVTQVNTVIGSLAHWEGGALLQKSSILRVDL